MAKFTETSLKLTLEGARAIVNAALDKAKAMGVSVCIAIVDDGGHLKAFARMDGAKTHSIITSQRKAFAGASLGRPTGMRGSTGQPIDLALATALQIASDAQFTTLPAGLPIIVEGQVVGGIGVGGATGEEDLMVAEAALAALK